MAEATQHAESSTAQVLARLDHELRDVRLELAQKTSKPSMPAERSQTQALELEQHVMTQSVACSGPEARLEPETALRQSL